MFMNYVDITKTTETSGISPNSKKRHVIARARRARGDLGRIHRARTVCSATLLFLFSDSVRDCHVASLLAMTTSESTYTA